MHLVATAILGASFFCISVVRSRIVGSLTVGLIATTYQSSGVLASWQTRWLLGFVLRKAFSVACSVRVQPFTQGERDVVALSFILIFECVLKLLSNIFESQYEREN